MRMSPSFPARTPVRIRNRAAPRVGAQVVGVGGSRSRGSCFRGLAGCIPLETDDGVLRMRAIDAALTRCIRGHPAATTTSARDSANSQSTDDRVGHSHLPRVRFSILQLPDWQSASSPHIRPRAEPSGSSGSAAGGGLEPMSSSRTSSGSSGRASSHPPSSPGAGSCCCASSDPPVLGADPVLAVDSAAVPPCLVEFPELEFDDVPPRGLPLTVMSPQLASTPTRIKGSILRWRSEVRMRARRTTGTWCRYRAQDDPSVIGQA